MAQRIDFSDFDGQTAHPECGLWEQMLADALDQTLTAVDQRWFDEHAAACESCGEMLGNAQRGAAWLDVLKLSPPEPSATLCARILAKTADAGAMPDMPVVGWIEPGTLPAVSTVRPLAPHAARLLEFPLRPAGPYRPGRMLFEPRLIMTAAMAFFSIALTLDLTGVRLNDLNANTLNPKQMRQSFFLARASAVRSYDSLRVVHVLESRMEDLRQVATPAPVAAPLTAPREPQSAPAEPRGEKLPEKKHRVSQQSLCPWPQRRLLRTAAGGTLPGTGEARTETQLWLTVEGGL